MYTTLLILALGRQKLVYLSVLEAILVYIACFKTATENSKQDPLLKREKENDIFFELGFVWMILFFNLAITWYNICYYLPFPILK